MPEIAKCRRRDCKATIYRYQNGTLIFCEECGERYQTRKRPDEARRVWERIVEKEEAGTPGR